MNYYDARQLKESGKWHYTRMNDGVVWAVGYCADHEGHDTKQEARECYRRYLLDNAKYDREVSNQQLRCKVCQGWTSKYVMVGETRMIFLCDEHRNREEVEKLVGLPGQAMSSW